MTGYSFRGESGAPTRAKTISCHHFSLAEIEAARERLQGLAIRTPLVRLHVDEAPAEIYLKLENLQPIGSFKIRGAGNAIRSTPEAELRAGVVTASTGNMAQGVAWAAREVGVPATVVVPDTADETKLAAVARLGARIEKLPFEAWWAVMMGEREVGATGRFIHPVADAAVIAGNGTAGLEIVEDLPDVDTVVTPFGGGGLTCGVAQAVKALKPDVRVLAAEIAEATPAAAALAAGRPVEVPYAPNFVTGIGSGSVLPAMWPLVRELVDGAVAAPLADIAAAIRLLFERSRVVAEGAGAASVAAALAGRAGGGKVVCVVSGGNLDAAKLVTILEGGVP